MHVTASTTTGGTRRRPRWRVLLTVLGALLLAGAAAPGAQAATPTLAVTRYDGDTFAFLRGTGYPPNAAVTVTGNLAASNGTSYAGGGTLYTDGTGGLVGGLLVPYPAGTVTLTVSAPGVSPQTVTLAPTAPGRPPANALAVGYQAGPGTSGPGVYRGGTTNLADTNAYPTTPIIPGPLPIPPGGVAIPVGANIQTYINNNPAGTQFNLAAGTYSGSGVLLPKAGDKFYGVKAGPGGTLLRGLGIQRANSSATRVEIHNLSITGFSDGGRDGAIDSDMHEVNAASGWVISNSEIYGNYLGASVGPSSLVENNTFHDNTCKGGAGGMTGTVWRYNQFLHNNIPGASDVSGDCAGIKVTVEADNQFVGNLISQSGHPSGGWMDVACHRDTFVDNISYDNDGSGFTDETGYNNTFTHNLAAGNGRNTPDPWRRSGIVIESSANDVASGNYAWENNGPGITIYEQSRPDAQGDARNGNNTLQGNTLDVAPSIIMININSPQNLLPNTVTSVDAMRVPKIMAGPQM
jgi:hypothetical protein